MSTEVKGSIVKTIEEFIKQTYGDTEYQSWIETLPEESKEVFSGILISTRWYPIDAGYNIPLKKMSDKFFNGDDKQAGMEAGKFSAEKGLKGIYKFFIKLGSPNFIINKASTILPTYFKPSKMEIIQNDEKDAILRIVEFEGISKTAEYRIAGWMNAALIISGAKNSKVEITTSIANGGPHTDYTMTWD